MDRKSQVNLRWPVIAASAVLLLAIGAGGTYVVLKSGAPSAADIGGLAVRAERESTPPTAAHQPPPQPSNQQTGTGVQTAKVVVGEQGFEPATFTLRAGAPARVTFVRTSDKTCATEVVFPSLDLKRALPLNTPVDIDFTPEKTGDIAFACGMNMLKGRVVVE
jgi:plastocyanin